MMSAFFLLFFLINCIRSQESPGIIIFPEGAEVLAESETSGSENSGQEEGQEQSNVEGSENGSGTTNNGNIALPIVNTKLAYYASYTSRAHAFAISVDETCEQIKFIMVSQSGNHYFGLGIGGNYSGIGENKMNGYAIVSKGDTVNDIWETRLVPDQVPVKQLSNDISCSVNVLNGLRTVTCTRDYITGDTKDELSFNLGSTQVIYAVGNVSNSTPVEHAYGDAGEHTVSFVGDECQEDTTSNTNHIRMCPVLLFGIIVIIVMFF